MSEIYEFLKREYIEHGITYDMQQVKGIYKKVGFSDKEIIDGYVEFNYYALTQLKHIWK